MASGMGRTINERFGNFWRELRRRRVLHSVGLYLAGSWLVLQTFDVALVEVGFPQWTMALSVWLVLVGLPVVTLASWRYDITRSGIRRTPPAVRAQGVDLSLKRIDYLARGLAEDIMHHLAIIKDLHVASRTATLELDTSNLDIPAIGKRLGVKLLLEGSVRRDGNQLRIVTQLIDADSGYQIWSGSYDRAMEGLFGIYDEISTAVASELHLTLAPNSVAIGTHGCGLLQCRHPVLL
jgi:adenylate cyclase